MGFGQRVAAARASEGGGVYLSRRADGAPGKFVVVIDTIKTIQCADGSGEAFVVEFEIASSNVDHLPAGTSAAWVQKLTMPGADGRIKAFFLALRPDLAGMAEGAFGTAVDAACAELQPHCGAALDAQTSRITTKRGLDIDAVTWSPHRGAAAAAG